MSGGHFDYQQHRFEDIAVEIEYLIESNDDRGYVDLYSGEIGYHFPPEVIEKFEEAVKVIRKAGKMAHRIDWLVSGDDGEESFLKRWDEEIGK